MFHTRRVQFTVYERIEAPAGRQDGAEALRWRCLHPAEAWVLARRTNRPHAAPRRLPRVARVG